MKEDGRSGHDATATPLVLSAAPSASPLVVRQKRKARRIVGILRPSRMKQRDEAREFMQF